MSEQSKPTISQYPLFKNDPYLAEPMTKGEGYDIWLELKTEIETLQAQMAQLTKYVNQARICERCEEQAQATK